ncbi:hypothetical protein [Massilia sp. CF038]|uniref:hypothetical protein n=1 Tax=Massilia sp. CF038 TaxID=1881045 RepID=UPI00091C9644|nr:hypothetical protein [Massilia sp. CF038]SHG50467.1 hypothetical protein SAMN05428948_0765 [Massilia sp. CF038]
MSSLHSTLACAALLLAGCASQTPNLDQQFGSAVHSLNQQQVLNPAAPVSPLVTGIDGKAAKSAYDNYQKSFKDPQPQTGALSIGVGR